MFWSLSNMEERWPIGIIGSLGALFSPISALIWCTFIFVGIDFITGIWASYVRSKRSGKEWAFESVKAWRTIYKLFFIMGGIILAHLLETFILVDMHLKLAKLFTGFCCGIEFWSYLENAAEISNHPMFRWVRKIMGTKIKEKTGIDINEDNANSKDSDHE